ncbi:MAG: hypothetical protein ACMZ63_03010 [Methylotenera sp.]
MKKIICLLMMFWLPLSMATAAIMSTDMMVYNDLHTSVEKAKSAEMCHQHPDNQSKGNETSHQCTFCNACLLASAGIFLSHTPMFQLASENASKHITLYIPIYSDHLSTTIKPPILH